MYLCALVCVHPCVCDTGSLPSGANPIKLRGSCLELPWLRLRAGRSMRLLAVVLITFQMKDGDGEEAGGNLSLYSLAD